MTDRHIPDSKRRRFRRFGKPLLALAAVAAVLLLCELLVRLFSLAPDVKAIDLSQEDSPDVVYQRSSNPVLGFELKPNFRHDAPDHRSTYASINSHGQRDVERDFDKPDGVRRVILLGDSVVEGHGLPHLDQTISRRLEMLYADGKTQVLNFGVSGYCTRSEIELLETKGLAFQPDDVIVVFVENDFNNFSPEAFRLGSSARRPQIVNHLFQGSQLFRLASVRMNLFDFGVDADPLAWSQKAIGDNNVVTGLERFRELAVEHGFRPLIAIWPHFNDAEISDSLPMPDGSDKLVIERVAEVYGLPAVRLSPSFVRHWKSLGEGVNPRQYYSVEGDQIHPNEKATGVAAEALRNALTDLESGRYRLEEAVGEDSRERAAVVAAALSLGETNTPDYAMVFVNDGRTHEQAGDLEAAAASYRKAIETDPHCFPALNNLGILLARQGSLAEAAGWLEKALAVRPSSADVHNNLGNLFLNAGDKAKASAHFQEAIRIRPEYAEAHYNLALLHMRFDERDKAESGFRRAIELEPRYVNAYQNLGILLGMSEDMAGAYEQFRRATQIDPQCAPAFLNMGHVLLKQNKLREAEVAYRRALEIDPNLADARQALAHLQGVPRKAEAR